MFIKIKKFLVVFVTFFMLISMAFAAENFYKKDVNFEPYMRNLQKSIKANWNPPKNGSKSNSVVLFFKISKDGRLLSNSVLKSSGNASYDKAAINALLATPLKPLPKEFNGKSVDVQFTFDYNVFGPSKSTQQNTVSSKNSAYNFEVLSENLYATNKKLIYLKDEYRYLKVMKVGMVVPNAKIMRLKIDCKNGQIGVKNTYFGSSAAVMADMENILNTNLNFNDNVKMENAAKKSDYYRVYNYVCQP